MKGSSCSSLLLPAFGIDKLSLRTEQRSMIIGCLPGAARFWQSIVKLTDDGKIASLGKTGVILFLNVYIVNRQNTNEIKNDSAV